MTVSQKRSCLLVALVCLAAPAAGSLPGNYPGQQPPPRTNQPPPQSYPPEGQPQGQPQRPPPGAPPGQQGPPSWQGQGIPPQQQQQQQQQPPYGGPRGPPQQGYRPPPQQGAPQGYPGGYQQSAYGRPAYPQQPQQPQQEGGGLFSRIANKFKGDGGGPPPSQYGGYSGQQQGGGGYGQQQAGQQYGGAGRPPVSNTWQGQMAQPGPGALTPSGPVRGPMGGGPQQGGHYSQNQPQQPYGQQQHRPQQPGQQQQQHQQQQQGQYGQQPEEGGGWTGGIKNLFGKVFVSEGENGSGVSGVQGGVPSFRPKGSTLAKKAVRAPEYGSMGGEYGMYQGGFPGAAMGMPGASELQGPGKPEFISVDKSIVFVLKPIELEKKKRKFKQEGAGKLQVVTVFDGTLTGFTARDGTSNCLRTTELLENNQHVMLQEAAQKIRKLRSEYKRRMDAEAKAMTPAERTKALEEHTRKVYSIAATEGGIHLQSIGPAVESQLNSVPLREGVNDMLAALSYRGIPITVVCAGYGNVAMEVLKKGAPSIVGPGGGSLSPHLKLVSNYFNSDEHQNVIDMYTSLPLITDATKNGATVSQFLTHSNIGIPPRPNAVVLGTELNDITLGSGLTGVDSTITVGFMKVDEHFLDKFPRYAAAYDVVILGNGDMSYVNELLLELTSQ